MGLFSRLRNYIKQKFQKTKINKRFIVNNNIKKNGIIRISKELKTLNNLYETSSKKYKDNSNLVKNREKINQRFIVNNERNNIRKNRISRISKVKTYRLNQTKTKSANNNISKKINYYYNLIINELYSFFKLIDQLKQHNINIDDIEEEIKAIGNNIKNLTNFVKSHKLSDFDILNLIHEIKIKINYLINIIISKVKDKLQKYNSNTNKTMIDKIYIDEIIKDLEEEYRIRNTDFVSATNLFEYIDNKLELPDVSKLKILIMDKLPNPKDGNFSYDNSVKALGTKDPFFELTKPQSGEYNLTNILEWFHDRNPNFVNISELDLKVPEFAFITAVMTKDLVLLHKTTYYPKKHSGNEKLLSKENICEIKSFTLDKNNLDIITVLKKVVDFISSNYRYNLFLEIVAEYISIFSTGQLNNEGKKICDKLKILDEILNTPYILYPSFTQLSYDKVICIMQVPLINFRLINKREIIHDEYHPPSYEFSHDINFHGYLTHKFDSKKKYINNNDLKLHFEKITKVIEKLKPLILYSNQKITKIDKNKRLVLAFMLFYIVHEKYGAKALFEIEKSLNSYIGDEQYIIVDKFVLQAIKDLAEMHQFENFPKDLEIAFNHDLNGLNGYENIKYNEHYISTSASAPIINYCIELVKSISTS